MAMKTCPECGMKKPMAAGAKMCADCAKKAKGKKK